MTMEKLVAVFIRKSSLHCVYVMSMFVWVHTIKHVKCVIGSSFMNVITTKLGATAIDSEQRLDTTSNHLHRSHMLSMDAATF